MSEQATPTPDTSHYAAKRRRDWEAFTSGSGALASHWERWAEESFDWRPAISFFQPVGKDYPDLAERIQPLFDALEGLEEVELPPASFLHLTAVQIGFLRAADLYWSQVETFYVNAAPRLHRIEPFSIRIGGVSAGLDALYLGVDDGLVFREARRLIAQGVPKVYQVFREAGIQTGDADVFVPEIPFAYFTGKGDRARVIEAITPHLDAELGEYPVSHIKMGRIAPDPDIHFPDPDVVAEIILFGKDHRKGYHN